MIRILREKFVADVQYIVELPENPFEELRLEHLWTGGFRGEYWEDEVVNFKFLIYNNYVSVYRSLFTEMHCESDVELFVRNNINIENLLEWFDKEVSLEVINVSPDDDSVKEIWKFDYQQCLTPPLLIEKDKHTVFRVNSQIIESIGYRPWADALKMRGDGITENRDKYYWFNLCLTKLYANRKHQTSDKECERVSSQL